MLAISDQGLAVQGRALTASVQGFITGSTLCVHHGTFIMRVVG